MSTAMLFFFQAEDGIRDTSVTGVQTCALPIFFLNHYVSSAKQAQALTEGNMHVKRNRCFRAFGLFENVFQIRGAEQIGRASCRERGEISVGGVELSIKNTVEEQNSN